MNWRLHENRWKWAFVVLVGLMLLILPNFIVPRVATLNPAVHSKTLMLQWLVVVLLLVAWLGRKSLAILPLRLGEITLGGFVLASLVSVVTAVEPRYAFRESWHFLLLPLVSLGLVRFSLSDLEREKLFWTLVAGGVVSAVYGLCVYFGYDFLRPWYPFAYSKADARNYVHSFLGNPEYFGGYMAPLAVVAFGCALAPGKERWSRLIWVGLAAFFLLSLVLSGTRGALLGTVSGVTYVGYGVLRQQDKAVKRIAYKAIAALLFLCVATVVVLSVPNPLNVRRMRLAQRFVSLFDLSSDSIRERILFYTVGSRMIRDHPLLGVGPGCFKLQFYPYIARLVEEDPRAGFRHFAETLQGRLAEHAHNDYLEFFCDSGIVGFASFCAVVAGLVVTGRRIARLSTKSASLPNPLRNAMAQAQTALGALFCLLINAIFSFPLHLPVRATVFWVLVGLFYSAAYSACDASQKPLLH